MKTKIRNGLNNGFFYFNKTILKKHLCAIQSEGLDSKYGGRGGASEEAAKKQGSHMDKYVKGPKYCF
jgi:hypothetical protein